MTNKIFALLLLFSFMQGAFAQAPAETKPTDDPAKLQKESVEFLRQTVAEVGSMRSLENRISFRSELASILWIHEEKEGRAMYKSVISDFIQLLLQLDTQMNDLARSAGAEDDIMAGGLFVDVSDRARLEFKISTALEMRKQIALSLAEHEPDLALAFFNDSITGLTSPRFALKDPDQDKYFEGQLMQAIASSDAAKGSEMGKRSLKDGVTFVHVQLLRKLYAKDPDKGIDFADTLVSTIKSTKSAGEYDVVPMLIEYGDEILAKTEVSKKKPVLSESKQRELAEALAQMLLSRPGLDYFPNNSLKVLDKYAPARAVQIRAKIVKRAAANDETDPDRPPYPPYPPNANYANTVRTTGATFNSNISSNVISPPTQQEIAAKAREELQRKAMEDVMTIDKPGLTSEAKLEIIARARKVITQTRARDAKIMGLGLIASQAAAAGEKEIAADIMKDAERLVNPQPKNYQDYLLTWTLITAEAQVEPDKAFPMLTDVIFRLNDTIAAFIKAGEFIDVRGEIIEDGELQVGKFGGAAIRSMTKELKIAEPTIKILAKNDIGKLKAVINSFDRLEVRIVAKMMVLRALLGKPEPEPDNIGG